MVQYLHFRILKFHEIPIEQMKLKFYCRKQITGNPTAFAISHFSISLQRVAMGTLSCRQEVTTIDYRAWLDENPMDLGLPYHFGQTNSYWHRGIEYE